MERVVLNIVNTSLPRSIDRLTLITCLRGEALLDPWSAHLATFFGESPIEVIEQFSFEHGISRAQLREAYRSIRTLTGERSPPFEEWSGALEGPVTPGA